MQFTATMSQLVGWVGRWLHTSASTVVRQRHRRVELSAACWQTRPRNASCAHHFTLLPLCLANDLNALRHATYRRRRHRVRCHPHCCASYGWLYRPGI